MDLKRYITTKEVLAAPMTRGEYNAYRGWEVPADENPADEGYLVEYINSTGTKNHPEHNGYFSWSPKNVFDTCSERAYEPWQKRLIEEYNQLTSRCAALEAYLMGQESPQPIMERQLELMEELQAILGARLEDVLEDLPEG